jgi:antimicrobial peptide system SdpB family protein
VNRIGAFLENTDLRTRVVAIARSTLALAEVSILLFNPDGILFPFGTSGSYDQQCAGLRQASLWCVASEGSTAMGIARGIAIAILLAVATGYRPRWTCIPHAYIAFSLSVDLTVPNGGEQVAQVLTMLLVPMLLGDRRTWQWRRADTDMDPTWRGAALAAHVTIRLQASIIYLNAAAAKLFEQGWRNGTAMYTISHHPFYSFPGLAPDRADVTGHWTAVVEAATWGAVATEFAICVLVLGTRRMRLGALVLGAALHLAIGLLMGLPSFSLVMISLLAIAYLGDSPSTSSKFAPNQPAEAMQMVAGDRK